MSPAPAPMPDPFAPGGPLCGDKSFALHHGLPGDVLVVLDRSDSMDDPIDDPRRDGFGTKWLAATDALAETARALGSQMKWGLELFPSADPCDVSAIQVPVGPGSAQAMSDAFAHAPPSPTASTPTRAAVLSAGAYLMSLKDANPKYLLLATDGEPGGCDAGQDDAARAVAAVGSVATMGIHTFVIGIATGGSSADTVLTQMATAGLEPRSGPVAYYLAGDHAELGAAIQAIATQVGPCSLSLPGAPGRPDLASLSAGGRLIARDPGHHEGWDFGAGNRSIVLYGSWCQGLQSGNFTEIDGKFPCVAVP